MRAQMVNALAEKINPDADIDGENKKNHIYYRKKLIELC